MKKIILSLGVGVTLIIAGCKNGNDEKESILTPEEIQRTQASPSSSANNVFQPDVAAPVATPAVNTTNTSGGALNPEHGQPGHRCDIAVGAPLDSKPAAPATTASATPASNTITPVVNTPAPVTATTTGSNLNPEHGKPGHRCDIAVGAPLDSRPATTTVQPATTSNPTVQTNGQKTAPVTPLLPASNSTTVAPGMNPEHGKPGHRCDIAVGAPLSGAAKQ